MDIKDMQIDILTKNDCKPNKGKCRIQVSAYGYAKRKIQTTGGTKWR